MLKANIKSIQNYKGVDLEKLTRSLQLLESAINSDKFKIAVLNFKSFQFVSYTCPRISFLGKRKMEQLQCYSNEEVYEILMKGHRIEGVDCLMDLKLQLSTKVGGSTIGSTDRNNLTTTYRTAFNRMNEGELAAHITHEWAHTMDFHHSYSTKCDSTRNCLSVPYAIGNIIEIILTGKCWYGCKYETLNK